MKTEYLVHAPCMRIVQSGYERCAIEYQSHVREHSGNATSALGTNTVDDPVENSKKLCWYVVTRIAQCCCLSPILYTF